MYTTILLKVRHLREIVVITKAKYLLQMLVPKFCTDSQSWFTKGTGWASLGLMVPILYGSQLQDAEQNMKWVPWSGEGCVMPNSPSCSVSVRDSLPHTRLAPHCSCHSLLRKRGSTPSANDSHKSPLRAEMPETRQEWVNAWSPREHKHSAFLAACNNCPGCSWWAPGC